MVVEQAMETEALVRFENLSTDFPIGYGLRIGAAEFVGPLPTGAQTGYHPTPSGIFCLEGRTPGRGWERLLPGAAALRPGHRYQVRLSGALGGGSLVWTVVKD